MTQNLPEWIEAIATLVIAGGLFVGWRQLSQNLEERYNKEYRKLLWSIPLEALLGKNISQEILMENLRAFYLYFDLSNEEVFLTLRRWRIAKKAASEWKDGIAYNMKLPAFQLAWNEIQNEWHNSQTAEPMFRELREFLEEKLPSDFSDEGLFNISVILEELDIGAIVPITP